MRKLVFMICAVFLCASGAQAQGKIATQWKCDKAAVAHSIVVGDQAGHAYSISQTKCAAAKGEIAGAQEKEGIGTEFHDVMGNSIKWHGIFVETLASGDKLHYSYEGTGTTKGGQFASGTNKWTITGGTGKLKGAKGEGSCTGKGKPDGTANWTCEGTYQTMAPPPPPKKK